MRLSSSWTLSSRVVALGVLLAGCLVGGGGGCSATDLAVPQGDQGVPGVDASIYFEHDGTLTLAPAQTTQVTIVGKPARRYAIALLLVGDALDASLDLTQVVADEQGRATVTLRAPSTATYFAMRATIKDGPSAQLNVAVSDAGFGDLLIEPDYTGPRDTREWVASVVAGTTCEALAPTLPNDPEGPEPVSEPPGTPILIEDVPVGPTLAVFVRGGHYMWGCADVANLRAGETNDVSVKVVDKPLDLSQSVLDVALGFEPDPKEWQELVSAEKAAFAGAFTGNAPEPEMLLEAMKAAYAGDAGEFALVSESNAWLLGIESHFVTYEVDLAAAIGALVDAGLAAEPPEVRAHLEAVDKAEEHALVDLLAIGTATPEIMQVPSQYVMSFSADAHDAVHVSGTFFWIPSRYLGHVSKVAGLSEHAGAVDMGDVLSELALCDGLYLDGLSTCDATCIAALCRDALAARWETALTSSSEALSWGELRVESAGAARFDDDARAVGFEGSWIGKLEVADLSAKVTGTATAETPTTP
jgi:hypothetical protein